MPRSTSAERRRSRTRSPSAAPLNDFNPCTNAPARDSSERDHSPLTELAVNSRLAEVRELAAAGRNAKTRNLWDPAWEEGVGKMLGAYEKLAQLNAELENDMHRLEQLHANRRHLFQTLPAVAGLCGTLLFAILSLALVLKPDFLHLLRRLLGLWR